MQAAIYVLRFPLTRYYTIEHIWLSLHCKMKNEKTFNYIHFISILEKKKFQLPSQTRPTQLVTFGKTIFFNSSQKSIHRLCNTRHSPHTHTHTHSLSLSRSSQFQNALFATLSFDYSLQLAALGRATLRLSIKSNTLRAWPHAKEALNFQFAYFVLRELLVSTATTTDGGGH